MKPKWVISLILLVLVIILIVQNTQVIVYRFFFWQIGASQIILVPLVLLVGFVIGYLVGRKGSKKQP